MLESIAYGEDVMADDSICCQYLISSSRLRLLIPRAYSRGSCMDVVSIGSGCSLNGSAVCTGGGCSEAGEWTRRKHELNAHRGSETTESGRCGNLGWSTQTESRIVVGMLSQTWSEMRPKPDGDDLTSGRLNLPAGRLGGVV